MQIKNIGIRITARLKEEYWRREQRVKIYYRGIVIRNGGL